MLEYALLQRITDGSLQPIELVDGSIAFNVYRFITRACGKHDDTNYGYFRWKHMITHMHQHYKEMAKLMPLCTFPLKEFPIPYTNVEGLQLLMVILGCKTTTEYHDLFKSALNSCGVSVARPVEQERKGYCYVASNKSMPGLVKIGFTEISPSFRVKQLFQTGVPEPFDLVAYISCDTPRLLETKMHEHFQTARVSTNREFFRVSGETVVAYMSHISRKHGNVHLHAVSSESQGIVEAEVHFLMLLFIEHTTC